MPTAFVGSSTPAAWRTWRGENALVEDGVVVRRTFGPPTVVHDADSGAVVDTALDRCGRLYVLTENGAVRRYGVDSSDSRRYEDFDADGDANVFAAPRALCVLDGTMYVAVGGRADGRRGGGGLFAVPRRTLVAQPLEDVAPVDPLALAASGRYVYLLDGGDGAGEGVVWQVDPAERTTPTVVVDGLTTPRDLAIGGDGVLAVVDTSDVNGESGWRVRGFDVVRGDDGTESLEPRPDATVVEAASVAGDATCLAVDSTDGGSEVVVGVVEGEGVAPERGGVRRYALDGAADPSTPFDADALPVGPAGLLAVRTDADRRRAYHVTALPGDDGRVVTVVADARNARSESSGRFDARLVTRFDAGTSGTRWHRLTLDVESAVVGAGTAESSTQVRVRYGATDDSAVDESPVETVPGIGTTYARRLRDAGIAWTSQLSAYDADELATVAAPSPQQRGLLRGRAEQWLNAVAGRSVSWSDEAVLDPRDVLVDATGRYLWVELELVGSEYVSPRVRELRAYFPRDSYLRYLPALYRADDRSAAFLERFLSLPESDYESIDANVDTVSRYLDRDGVPAESLSWLGRWIGLKTDETWPESVKRAFLAEAPALFRGRGTPGGLVATLRLYLDANAEAESVAALAPEDDEAGEERGGSPPEDVAADLSRVVALWEHADLDPLAEGSAVRASYRRLLNSPVGFVVLVGPGVTDDELAALGRLVDAETPVHAAGRVVRLTPWVRLGGHSYLGYNTSLATREFVLDRSALGVDSMVWNPDG
jgi:phage tail-like protein